MRESLDGHVGQMRGLIAKQLGHDMRIWDNVGRWKMVAHLHMIVVSPAAQLGFDAPTCAVRASPGARYCRCRRVTKHRLNSSRPDPLARHSPFMQVAIAARTRGLVAPETAAP